MSISKTGFFFPRIPERLLLNVIAVFSVVVGLLNTALAWVIYGAGGKADIWMLSFVVAQAFVLLSQLGVEQYAVFSAEHATVSEQAGKSFDRQCLSWSLMFGTGFAGLLAVFLPSIVGMFAAGFSAAAQAEVLHTVYPLLLQVALAPMLYVLRQQLLMQGRAKLSILLNSTFSMVQLLVLAGGWVSGQLSPAILATLVGLGSLLAATSALFSSGPLRDQFARPDWYRLWPFIRASAALRFTHSIHNFLVVLLTNSALSGGVPGTVSLFQYVKKIADGISSVAIGPHLQVYHAAQAGAWARSDKRLFHKNIREYLLHALPVIAIALAGILVCWRFAGDFIPSLAHKATTEAFWIFVVLSTWQVLISVESVPAGVLVVGKHTRWLLLVNALFVMNFYLMMHVAISAPYSAATVATMSLLCQCISSTIISFLALMFYRKKFEGVNRA